MKIKLIVAIAVTSTLLAEPRPTNPAEGETYVAQSGKPHIYVNGAWQTDWEELKVSDPSSPYRQPRVWVVNSDAGFYTGVQRASGTLPEVVDYGEKIAGPYSRETVFDHIKRMWFMVKAGDTVVIEKGDMSIDLGLESGQTFNFDDWVIPDNVTFVLGKDVFMGNVRLAGNFVCHGGTFRNIAFRDGADVKIFNATVKRIVDDGIDTSNSVAKFYAENCFIRDNDISGVRTVLSFAGTTFMNSSFYFKDCRIILQDTTDASSSSGLFNIRGNTLTFDNCQIGHEETSEVGSEIFNVGFANTAEGFGPSVIKFVGTNQIYGNTVELVTNTSGSLGPLDIRNYGTLVNVSDTTGQTDFTITGNSLVNDSSFTEAPFTFSPNSGTNIIVSDYTNRDSDIEKWISDGNTVDIMLCVGQSNASPIFSQAVFYQWLEVDGPRPYLWDRYSRSGTAISTWSSNVSFSGNNAQYQADFITPLRTMRQRLRQLGAKESQVRVTVFWNQGEADALASSTEATYRLRIGQIFDRLQQDQEIDRIVLCLPDVDTTNPALPAGYTDAKMAPIRAAIIDYAATSSKITTVDLDTSIVPRPPEGLHFDQTVIPQLGAVIRAAWDSLP